MRSCLQKQTETELELEKCAHLRHTASRLPFFFMKTKHVPAHFFSFCVATNKRMLPHALRCVTILQLRLACCASGTVLTRELHDLCNQVSQQIVYLSAKCTHVAKTRMRPSNLCLPFHQKLGSRYFM